ncbi:MAG: GLUG motif-containing protein [Paludibacter sp.]|nr:GLUG motif-containing protein [Paludibacter sp.]
MKKQILLISGLCLAFVLQAQTATVPSIGDGSSSNPYQIATLNNLYWLSQNTSEWDKNFIQTTDINASTTSTWDSGAGWTPLGSVVSETSYIAFTGSYNGTGHSISGLTINRPSIGNVGFFGLLYGATIQNLGLVNVTITGGVEMTGALTGMTYNSTTTVSNCYSTGTVNGINKVGGLVGMNEGSVITHCYSNCTINCSEQKAGGLVGKNSGVVRNCYATGAVSSAGITDDSGSAGGLIGTNFGSVTKCYATGVVSACREIGGLIGKSTSEDGGAASVDSCYATGAVTVIGSQEYTSAGGLVGDNYITSSISNSYATGSVTGLSISSNVGGLVGDNYMSAINYCFATGVVSGGGSTGGLVGNNNTSSTISNCYARGNVTGTSNNVGGLVGRNGSSSINNSYSTGTAYSLGCYGGVLGSNEGGASISNSFWDTNTSGLTSGCGYNEATFNATSKTTSEMKIQSTFTNASWDFSSIWAISSTVNDGYPSFIGSISNAVVETKADNKISFYPNPATDVFQIVGIEESATITLSDLDGRSLFTKEVTANEMISVSTLPKKIYLVTVKSNYVTKTEKLIIQR